MLGKAQREQRAEAVASKQEGRKSGKINYAKLILLLFIIVMAGLAGLLGLQDNFLSR